MEDVAVLKVKVDMWGGNHWELLEDVRKQVESDATRIVLDFSLVKRINSTGVSVVAACLKAARDAGGDLKLCSLNDAVVQVFTISGMQRILEIHPDQPAAIASFEGAPA